MTKAKAMISRPLRIHVFDAATDLLIPEIGIQAASYRGTPIGNNVCTVRRQAA